MEISEEIWYEHVIHWLDGRISAETCEMELFHHELNPCEVFTIMYGETTEW